MDSENQELNTQNQNPEPPKRRVRSNIWIRYLVTFSSCAVAVLIYISIAGIFSNWEVVYANTHWNINSELSKNLYIFTNATFVIGVLCTMFGLLVIATNGGAFEMFAYGMRRFFSFFQRDINKIRFKTFYDYHVYKSSEPKRSFAHLLVVGIFVLALSGLFLALYMNSMK